MTNLSPAAQAVLDDVLANTEPDCDTLHLIAAALRAAVMHTFYREEIGMTAYGGYGQQQDQILAIATELENHDA